MCNLWAVEWLDLALLTSATVYGSRCQRREARFVNGYCHCAWLDVLS